MQPSNNRTFNQNVSTIKRSGETVATAIQNAVIQALLHYKENEDTIFLTRLMDAARGSSAIRTNTLKEFIKAHANVIFTKSKAKNDKTVQVFKKINKKEAAEIKEVTSRWQDFNHEGNVTPDIDAIARAKSFMTILSKALKGEKHLKDGQREQAEKLLNAMQGALEV